MNTTRAWPRRHDLARPAPTSGNPIGLPTGLPMGRRTGGWRPVRTSPPSSLGWFTSPREPAVPRGVRRRGIAQRGRPTRGCVRRGNAGKTHPRVVLIGTGVLAVWLAAPSLLLGIIMIALLGRDTSPDCAAPQPDVRGIGWRGWSSAQTDNAHLITTVVIRRGLPRRAAVVAVAAAIAESGLRNLPAGDRDSLGLFQQRPSQGWGHARQIVDPTNATTQFLTHLLAVPGWAALPPGVAEQTVQRSAHPDTYAPAEAPAADLVDRYWPTPASSPSRGVGDPMQLTAFEPTGCPNHHTIPPTSPEPSIRIPADSWPVDPRARAAATAALAYAWAQVGKPYVWGAAGPDTFDCSGLVQASWAAAGVAIGRTTATQVHDGTPVPDLEQLQPGDLLFIPGDDGTRSQPRHVGLFTGRGQVIDAYSASRGIVLEPLARWAPKIVAIRRVAHPARPGR